MSPSLANRLLPALGCFGRLGSCPSHVVKRFRFTCLHCRWRRAQYTGYQPPPFYLKYIYRSLSYTRVVPAEYLTVGGQRLDLKPGAKVALTTYRSVAIDPRGPFTAVRVAAIRVLDALMLRLGIGKPLVELCEFLANYPT